VTALVNYRKSLSWNNITGPLPKEWTAMDYMETDYNGDYFGHYDEFERM
jgi:hypothetical protein